MAPKASPDPLAELPFETLLTRLQAVVDKLEKGDLPLEKAMEIFEEGVRLSRAGSKRLDQAESRVEQLLQDENGVRTQALEKEQTEP